MLTANRVLQIALFRSSQAPPAKSAGQRQPHHHVVLVAGDVVMRVLVKEEAVLLVAGPRHHALIKCDEAILQAQSSPQTPLREVSANVFRRCANGLHHC